MVGDDTEVELMPDPVILDKHEAEQLHDLDSTNDFAEILDQAEWDKVNFLLDIGLFNNATEVISFLLHEGIKARSDIFEKSSAIKEQMKQLKENIKTA